MINYDIKITCICGKHKIPDKWLKATEFLMHSNFIENERSAEALEDAHRAWEYALALNKITLRELLKIHHILMKRINPRVAGQLRKVNVHVGFWLAPNPGSLRRLMYQFLHDFNWDFSNLEAPFMEDTSRSLHIRFEKTHPFEDGNGRIGRILYNWQRVKYHLPIHIIHEGKEQQAYYDWFK